MTKSIFLILLICSLLKVHSQPILNPERSKQCQIKWEYLELEKDISGTLIFYDRPFFLCGMLSNASVSLIKLNTGDTIRVLSMCDSKDRPNSKNKYSGGIEVIVKPSTKPKFRVDIIPPDPKACDIFKSYFGLVQKTK